MKKYFKNIVLFFSICVLLSLSACANKDNKKIVTTSNAETNAGSKNDVEVAEIKKENLGFTWSDITTKKYRHNLDVKYLIAVKYKGGYDAEVILYEKDDTPMEAWTEILRCDGVMGKKGIDKEKEGDSKCPTGDFSVGNAFGIKMKPKDIKLPYIDIDDNTYCCGDETAYNKIINISEMPHDCKDGEHMIDYSPEYNYGFEIAYNAEGVPGKGSAIFFHCKGAKAYTGGCIAVDENNILKMLEKIDENTRVIINYSD